MLMLCDNVPKSVVQYMICKGVLLTPDNPWAINDLGIIFRNEKQNKEAAQCFKYAFSFNDTFQIIKCNLAWAVAYYGDFITAKKYFHEILDRLPNYSEAWEGLGMIAYKEGDIATLFKCLSAQVKNVGGGGDGPSDNFTSFCGGVIDEQRINNITKPKDSDPSKDHTFDNENEEENQNYDPPPNGESEYPTYPNTMGGMFAQNEGQLFGLLTSYSDNIQLVSTILKM
jgi:tetratricopeptide (TPR) repeat protein